MNAENFQTLLEVLEVQLLNLQSPNLTSLEKLEQLTGSVYQADSIRERVEEAFEFLDSVNSFLI